MRGWQVKFELAEVQSCIFWKRHNKEAGVWSECKDIVIIEDAELDVGEGEFRISVDTDQG